MSYAAAVLLLLRRLSLALLLLVAAGAAWILGGVVDVANRPIAAAPIDGTSTDVITRVLSTRRVASVLVPVVSAQGEPAALQNLVQELLVSATPRSCVVIRQGGTNVVSVRPDMPLAPGFAQMFLTGVAALDVLGPDHSFVTTVNTAATLEPDGRLPGSITLVGGGDPVLLTAQRAAAVEAAVWTPLDALAEQLAVAGVTVIDGGVLVDDTRYDTVRSIPGWAPAWPQAQQIGLLGALQVNDGTADTGSAPTDSDANAQSDPGLRAADHFVSILTERGISTNGSITRVPLEGSSPELSQLGQVASAPLRAIVRDMWERADPTTAEMLMKELGYAANDSTPGASSADGGKVVQRVAASLGAILPLSPRDGSGLDPTAQLTCNALTEVIGQLPPDHPALDALVEPGASAFDGQFDDGAFQLGRSLVGGGGRTARGLVGRIETGDVPITFAALANNAEQLTPSDLLVHANVLQAVALIEAETNP